MYEALWFETWNRNLTRPKLWQTEYRDLVSLVLLVPTVALHSLLQALLVVLRDPVANLFEILNNLVF